LNFLTKKQRGRLMSRIRSVSRLELSARSAAERRTGCKLVHGTRKSGLPGSPDYYSKKNKVVVFVHGCFWHGCREHFKQPQTNAEYWHKKISRNRQHDRAVRIMYKNLRWRVVTIWEHSLKPTKAKT
jgi:DNA mismatch endonuclease (patch repair protein)